MVGWHHWLNGHGFGWTPGVGDGQGGLACCDSWGRKESDTTEQLNWTEINPTFQKLNSVCLLIHFSLFCFLREKLPSICWSRNSSRHWGFRWIRHNNCIQRAYHLKDRDIRCGINTKHRGSKAYWWRALNKVCRGQRKLLERGSVWDVLSNMIRGKSSKENWRKKEYKY